MLLGYIMEKSSLFKILDKTYCMYSCRRLNRIRDNLK